MSATIIDGKKIASNFYDELKEKISALEAEIEELDNELFGAAATDYVRAAEIDRRKCEIEEELLSLYELVM